jgi:hypothetical protein
MSSRSATIPPLPRGILPPCATSPLREFGCAIGFVVLLASLYVGAYCAMAEMRVEKTWLPAHEPGLILVDEKRTVRYRLFGGWAAAFFEPMHEVDKNLRPYCRQVNDGRSTHG